MFQGVPRWIIAGGVVLIAGLELVSRLPDIMLIPQRLAGQAGDYGGKAEQPGLIAAQTEKTEAEAKLAQTQAQLNEVQQGKIAADTRVAQLQADVTAAQVDKTQAETRLAQTQAQLNAAQQTKLAADTQLAQAQTTGTNLTNVQQGLGLAASVAILGAGAKLFGAFGHALDAQQEPSQDSAALPASQPASPFEAGRTDWHRWHDWEHGLSADGFAGAEYWAGARTNQPPPDCRDGATDPSAEFLNGCAQAQRILAGADQARHTQAAYRDGWNAGAKETGDL